MTTEGIEYAEAGSPEYQVAMWVKANPEKTQEEIMAAVGKKVASVGFGTAMKEQWIEAVF